MSGMKEMSFTSKPIKRFLLFYIHFFNHYKKNRSFSTSCPPYLKKLEEPLTYLHVCLSSLCFSKYNCVAPENLTRFKICVLIFFYDL